MLSVRVQAEDFDVGAAFAALRLACPEAGALANFLGVVRSDAARPVSALTLEHYPGMTEAEITRVAGQAMERFRLHGCMVMHRVGTLAPGDAIVLVLTAASHRQAALDGTAFLIDWLKVSAPFWKKEHLADGTAAWVDAREGDDAAAVKWGRA